MKDACYLANQKLLEHLHNYFHLLIKSIKFIRAKKTRVLAQFPIQHLAFHIRPCLKKRHLNQLGQIPTLSHQDSAYLNNKVNQLSNTINSSAGIDFVEGTGSMQSTDIVAEYIRRISEEIPVSLGDALKVVVDCGNGVPGMVAPAVLRAIGHDVIELFCDVDGDFPNHHPDPSQPENLQQLIAAVFDGFPAALGERAGGLVRCDLG